MTDDAVELFTNNKTLEWQTLIKEAIRWRSFDRETMVTIGDGEFVVKRTRTRITGLDVKRSNSTRCSAMAELENPTRTLDDYSLIGEFIEINFFATVPIPIRALSEGPGAMKGKSSVFSNILVGETFYKCFDLDFAFARRIPVYRDGILLEAKRNEKGRDMRIYECIAIKELAGMIVSRGKEYIVRKGGCIDISRLIVYEKDYDWDSVLGEKPKRIEIAHQSPFGLADVGSRPFDLQSVHMNVGEQFDGDLEIVKVVTGTDQPNRQILNKFSSFIRLSSMIGDGHCGFRVLAHLLLGDQEKYDMVRTRLSAFFEQYRESYMSEKYRLVRPSVKRDFNMLLKDIQGVTKMRNRWFVAPWHAQLSADCFNVIMAVLSSPTTMRLTLYVPRSLNLENNGVIECIQNGHLELVGMLFVNENHWNAVEFDWISVSCREAIVKGIEEGFIDMSGLN